MRGLVQMRPFDRSPSELERFLETADDTVQNLASGWSKGKVVKAGLIAGGLAALTAGSAAISSLRRRDERAKGRS
jgi:hypothetical protein